MGNKRQNIQLLLAFDQDTDDEVRQDLVKGTELSTANLTGDDETNDSLLMEEICQRDNLLKALKRVQRNQGAAGVDGMSIHQLSKYLKRHWLKIRAQLLAGIYKPLPVKRVEIRNLEGKERTLGIPTVLDRFIQQAVLQVLQPIWDPTFSEHSYGFRPGKSAHQAVVKSQEYLAQGFRYVVDVDIEKFFDHVQHDQLMSRLAGRISDKRVLKLIRAYLQVGIMENGLVRSSAEGAPQGGPLSPLLSNIVLDMLDRELENRGHRFVRFADDCNIYVRSLRAGQRVMKSLDHFLTRRLHLTINMSKSAVDLAGRRSFLGFGFTSGRDPKRRLAPRSVHRFKTRIRQLTRRSRGISLRRMIDDLRQYLTGWRSYFGFCQTPSVFVTLDSWIRRRLRCFQWKHWKRGKNRFAQLRRLGVGKDLAAQTAGSPHGPWHLSRSPALSLALSNDYLQRLGLPSLA